MESLRLEKISRSSSPTITSAPPPWFLCIFWCWCGWQWNQPESSSWNVLQKRWKSCQVWGQDILDGVTCQRCPTGSHVGSWEGGNTLGLSLSSSTNNSTSLTLPVSLYKIPAVLMRPKSQDRPSDGEKVLDTRVFFGDLSPHNTSPPQSCYSTLLGWQTQHWGQGIFCEYHLRFCTWKWVPGKEVGSME